MAGMSVNPIDTLESQLELLTEGALARLFRRAVSARDIAVLLLRSIENNAAPPAPGQSKPVAPDLYHIHLHPEIRAGFLAQHADFPLQLARLIIDLCEDSGFQLAAKPMARLLESDSLTPLQARITAEHSALPAGETARMPAVDLAPQPTAEAPDPLLHINGARVVPLGKSVINIGRESSNDIVIADAYISRHHLQLRKRFGAYTLFDVNSRGGARVNERAVANHRLRHGDVIHIGRTTLVYADSNGSAALGGTTQLLSPD